MLAFEHLVDRIDRLVVDLRNDRPTWEAIAPQVSRKIAPAVSSTERFRVSDGPKPKPLPGHDRRCPSVRGRSWHPSASGGAAECGGGAPAWSGWRAYPPGGNHAVAADPDGFGAQPPDKLPLRSFDRDAEGFEQRTPSAKMAISVVVLLMSSAMASSRHPVMVRILSELAAGLRVDRLNWEFHGLLDLECPAIGLQDVDRDVYPPFAYEAEDLMNEVTVPFPDGLVEIGCRDAPGKLRCPDGGWPSETWCSPGR